jgi:hypothetical protein
VHEYHPSKGIQSDVAAGLSRAGINVDMRNTRPCRKLLADAHCDAFLFQPGMRMFCGVTAQYKETHQRTPARHHRHNGYAPAALDIAIAIRNLVVKRIARNPELPGIKLEDACVAIAAGYGKPVENLGTWLRAACFRHAVLMLDSSFCNPQYPSRNDDNFRMLNIARQVEQSLNQL